MTTATASQVIRSPAPGAVLDALSRLIITNIAAAFVEAEGTPARPGVHGYRVRVGPGARWACSCPAARYGARGGEPCKHAAALRLVVGTLPADLRGELA